MKKKGNPIPVKRKSLTSESLPGVSKQKSKALSDHDAFAQQQALYDALNNFDDTLDNIQPEEVAETFPKRAPLSKISAAKSKTEYENIQEFQPTKARLKRRANAVVNAEDVLTRTLPKLNRSSNVPLSEDPFVVSMKGWGELDSVKEGHITVEGEIVSKITEADCGLYLVVLETDVHKKFKVADTAVFNMNKSYEEAQKMHEFLMKKALGSIVLGASAMDISRHLKYGAGALEELGLNTSNVDEGSSVVFVGKKGYPEFLSVNIGHSGQGPVSMDRDLLYDPLKEAIKQAKLDKEEEYENDTNPEFIATQQFLITADELKKRKQGLTAALSKKVSLSREQIFDKHKVSDYFPLEHLKDAFLSRGHSTYYNRIDLGGVEQVTDMFFHMASVFVKDSVAVKHVTEFDLVGCYNITDQGIKVMAETFPHLKELQLYGCRKVTEKSLFTLPELCPQLELLQAQATGIGVICVPQFLKPDTGQSITIGLRLWGCPLVSPPETALPKDETLMTGGKYLQDWKYFQKVNLYKMVVVDHPGMRTCMTSFLVDKQNIPPKPLQFHANYQISPGGQATKQSQEPESKIQADGESLSEDLTYNIIECSQDLLHLFVSERTIYVLTYDADSDIATSRHYLTSTMSYIYCKVHEPVFVLVGVGHSAQTAVKTSQDMLLALHKDLRQMERATYNFKQQSIEQVQIDRKSPDFREQKVQCLAFDLHDSLQNLPQRIITLTLENEQGMEELRYNFLSAAKQIDETYPVYSRIHSKCWNLAKTCPKQEGLIPEQTFVRLAQCCMLEVEDTGQQLTVSDLELKGMGRTASPYKKCLQIMDILGTAVCLKSDVLHMSSVSVHAVLNLEWFATLVNATFDLPPQGPSGDAMFLQSNIPVWIYDEALVTLTNSSEENPVFQRGDVESMLQHLQGVCTHDGMLLRLDALPNESPYSPKPASENEHLLTVQCQYTTGLLVLPLQTINNLLLGVSQFASLRKAKILVMSKSCILLQELPVEVMFNIHQVTKKDKYLGDVKHGAVTLSVTVPWFPMEKSPEYMKTHGSSFLNKHGHNIYSDYKVLLENVFAADRLFWDQEVTFSWDGSKSADNKDVNDSNLKQWLEVEPPPNHVFKCDAELEGNVDCELCHILAPNAAILSNLYKGLKPCMVDQTSLAVQEDEKSQDVRQMGNRVILNPGGPYVVAKETMSPWRFSSFQVLRKAGKNVLVGVRVLSKSGSVSTYMYSLAEGNVRTGSSVEPYKTDLHILTFGQTLTVRLQEGPIKKDHILEFLCEGEVLCSIPVSATAQISPYLEKTGQATVLLNMTSVPSGWKDIPLGCQRSSPRAFTTQLASALSGSEEMLSLKGLPSHPACLVPAKLSPLLLQFPVFSQVWDFNALAIDFLCHSKDGIHLVKGPYSKALTGDAVRNILLKYSEELVDGQVQNPISAFLAHCMTMLLATKYIIPKQMTGLEEQDGTQFEKLNKMMQYVIEVALSGLFLMAEEQLWFGGDPNKNNGMFQAVIAMWNETQVQMTPMPVQAKKRMSKKSKSKTNDTTEQIDTEQIGISAAHGTPGTLQCNSHSKALLPGSQISVFPMDDFADHSHLITQLDFSFNNITSLPDNFWQTFPELTCLLLSNNKLTNLPPNPGPIQVLDISDNCITELPAGFEKCKETLVSLNISNNPLVNIPDEVYYCSNLAHLQASHLNLTELKPEIANLSCLVLLDLTGHQMESLPTEFSSLASLEQLMLDGLHWLDDHDSTKDLLSRSAFNQFLDSHAAFAKLEEKERDHLYNGNHSGTLATLDHKEIQRVNAQIYARYPRFGKDSSDDYGGVPPEIFALKNLKKLSLAFHGITKVTEHFSELGNLEYLDVSNNPQLENIAGEVGTLPLTGLNLKNCPLLKTPPREIVGRGFVAVYGYLRRLLLGSVTCCRTKLMLVGLGGAGKTSLVKALTSGRYQSVGTQGEAITDGIDITTWQVKNDEEEGDLTFSVWDFAGQTVYYNTHQFFLSNRSVYLLLWNLRLGYEHAGLDFWLSSIACHAPRAPVIVVGTHKDQVEKFSLPKETLEKRYPQIRAFHTISSFTGEGVEELANSLVSITLQEKYMGEKIPEPWLNLEKKVLGMRSNHNMLPWQQVEGFAVECGIFEKLEIRQAVQFLHDLGSLQHFQHPQLKSLVVINPQWIVDVMACVVSVHNTAILEGKLHHKDIKKIWEKYDPDLHRWMLTLTEQFDLTFPLEEESSNLVPCLMPEAEPQYTWQDVTEGSGLRETKMLYIFEYLPAGLFNRAQVRLHQFCDSSVLWKRGSLLKKNGHFGLLTQPFDCQVLVRVQGSRPENILFLVHEVFEALIAESFHGVSYDFHVPCSDCLKVGSHDPCMFAASMIRRATELKAPFLQCNQYFHTLTLTELHAMMPPEAGSDFDVHLSRNMNDLRDLRDELKYDVFMFYCSEDVPKNKNKKDVQVDPRQIYQDLQNAGLTVWFPKNPSEVSMKEIAVTMKDSKMVLVCISDAFVSDDHCSSVFYYGRQTLHKKVQVAVIGQGWGWRKTNLGLYLSNDVFVNMNNPDRYPVKIKELINVLSSKTSNKKNQVYPPCFISYCWSNSKEAVDKGSRHVSGAVGWGDPRKFKEHLEKEGVACWVDTEQVGQAGLFEDIADGLRHAKVMVACVSDEYAKSKNCCMELRFAAVTLKIPLVIAVVGTGFEWELHEIGMLALSWPKVMFQYESPNAYDRLVKLVKDKLPEESQDLNDTAASELSPPQTPVDNYYLGFQEMLELAQRKFLRQLTGYADALDTVPYPRLVVIDYLLQREANAVKQVDVSTNKAPESSENPEDANTITDKNANETVEGDVAEESITDQFCVCILCEHEQGWHISGQPLPVPEMSEDSRHEMLMMAAPYMARITAILRHTDLDLPSLRNEAGKKLGRLFEENSKPDCEFEAEYRSLIASVMNVCDPDKKMADLARCQLASGKVLWLCKDHQSGERVTLLEEDAPDVAVMELPAEGLALERIHNSGSEADSRPKSSQHGPLLKRQSTMAHLKKQNVTSSACNVM